jgi:Ribbon-helix-helix protein, copG family
MTRINVYSHDDPLVTWDDDPSERNAAQLLGWFDYDKAEKIHEDTEWDGSNHISVATGSQWDHEMLLRTAQGRWVLKTYSNRQGVMDSYCFVNDGEAREWLLRNNDDENAAKHFGPVEEERGPGRPKVGGKALISIGDDLLSQVDAYAKENGQSRAEVVRTAVAEFLTAASE